MKAFVSTELPLRTPDKWGEGHFGASRGDRTHNGTDYECAVGSEIQSPCNGEVTKLGYVYSDDLSFRYVQITDAKGRRHRCMYTEPTVRLHAQVQVGYKIGVLQDLDVRYRDISPHVHYEIIDTDGNYINPEEFIDE